MYKVAKPALADFPTLKSTDEGALGIATLTGVTYVWNGKTLAWEPKEVEQPVLLTDPAVTITGVYTAIKFLTDGVTFTTLAGNIKKNGIFTSATATDFTADMMPQGDVLPGIFTEIKIATGKVLLLP